MCCGFTYAKTLKEPRRYHHSLSFRLPLRSWWLFVICPPNILARIRWDIVRVRMWMHVVVMRVIEYMPKIHSLEDHTEYLGSGTWRMITTFSIEVDRDIQTHTHDPQRHTHYINTRMPHGEWSEEMARRSMVRKQTAQHFINLHWSFIWLLYTCVLLHVFCMRCMCLLRRWIHGYLCHVGGYAVYAGFHL